MSTIVARGSDWVPLSGVGQRRLGEARLQAHHAIQWLARVARAYVLPQPDDSHTSVGWDGDVGGFTTHPLKDRAWLSLNIIDLTLVLRGGEVNTHVHPFSLDGRTNAQAHQWLSEQLDALGLDAHALDMPLPYEMPVHAVSQGAPYDLSGLTDVLAQLAAWGLTDALGTVEQNYRSGVTCRRTDLQAGLRIHDVSFVGEKYRQAGVVLGTLSPISPRISSVNFVQRLMRRPRWVTSQR